MNISRIRSNRIFIRTSKLIIVSLIIGFLSAFLGLSLKHITEYYEHLLFGKAQSFGPYFFLFPLVGLSMIFVLRKYLFKGKQNKGIREIFDTTNSRKKSLPVYKIPSHYINGLLTVAFGGSTGIEVSTVVSTAAIGSIAQRKDNLFRRYKTELICAGVAAGITVLFNSPLAGILFAYEVIARKLSRIFFLTTTTSIFVATGLFLLLEEPPLFPVNIDSWNFHAAPYMIALAVFAALVSVYLTKCVMLIKSRFGRIRDAYYKVLIGASIVGISLWVLPELYGDGYHAMHRIFDRNGSVELTNGFAFTLILILILKPIITSVTLASGGDGGVFAPSLFIGAFLGLLVAVTVNGLFDANVVPLNFMVIGMAAVLSASIHAPFTALFLICGLTNSYVLFVPLLATCLLAKITAKAIYPATVYTYVPVKAEP